MRSHRRLLHSMAPLAAAGTAIQIVPAATWLPAVRQRFPALAGEGRPDHLALTFDDGPDPASTPTYLDLLAAHGVRATFFVVGERVVARPDLVRRIHAAGHEVAIHGWRHRYALYTSPGLGRCVDAVVDTIGVRPQWFRPPYGVFSASALVEARRHGLLPVLWTVWAKDWTTTASAESVHARLEPGLRGGATVLLHDAGMGASPTAWHATRDALDRVLDSCAQRGLAVGPLREHEVREIALSARRSGQPAPSVAAPRRAAEACAVATSRG